MSLSSPLVPTAFDAIIFDLGGVILPLSYGRTIDGLSALLGRDAREIYQETSQESLFDRFERGEIGQEMFRDSLRALSRAERPPTDEELDGAWNAILEEIPEDHVALLRGLSRVKRTFLLSNTNEIHLAKFEADYDARHAGLHGPFWTLFEKDYYSHRIGLRKPDRAAFLHILDGHSLRPERTLFIDDNHYNVDAARALGLSAILHPRNEKLSPYFEGWLDSSELAF